MFPQKKRKLTSQGSYWPSYNNTSFEEEIQNAFKKPMMTINHHTQHKFTVNVDCTSTSQTSSILPSSNNQFSAIPNSTAQEKMTTAATGQSDFQKISSSKNKKDSARSNNKFRIIWILTYSDWVNFAWLVLVLVCLQLCLVPLVVQRLIVLSMRHFSLCSLC